MWNEWICDCVVRLELVGYICMGEEKWGDVKGIWYVCKVYFSVRFGMWEYRNLKELLVDWNNVGVKIGEGYSDMFDGLWDFMGRFKSERSRKCGRFRSWL